MGRKRRAERGSITELIIAIIVVIAMVYVVFFVYDVPHQWQCQDDCSDVKSSNPRRGEITWTIEGVENFEINRIDSDAMQVTFYAVMWLEDGEGDHFQVSDPNPTRSLQKLEDSIDSLDMSEENKEAAHHIIDCIQRGCK